MLPLSQRQKIRELRAQGLSLSKVRQIAKEMFGRETLSMQTCLNIINEEPLNVPKDFLTEEYQEKVEKAWSKQRNKAIEEALYYKASLDKTIELFQQAMKKIKPVKIESVKEKKGAIHAYYVISDLHYGRTTSDLYANFSKFVDAVKHDSITLVILGDLFESPMLTGMHESQIEEMDVLGVDQVLGCMNMVAEGVKKLLKKGVAVKILGITGNHDRVSKNRESDPQRIVGILGYTYLRQLLGEVVEVEFLTNKVMNRLDGESNLILHHGDNGFNGKSSQQILSVYGKLEKHNIIISGHYHSPSMETGTGYVRVMAPTLNSPSSYESHQFISKSNAGWVVIEGKNVLFQYV